mmetsp:Transcript_11555/g.16062  ORF Transcript_11555/g.16062 Transcript_11555/m.16062 type:complete len:293 (-) Transcript_11555:62-940(-)
MDNTNNESILDTFTFGNLPFIDVITEESQWVVICMYLNNSTWRLFGEQLKFTKLQLDDIERRENPAKYLLQQWQHSPEATVKNFVTALVNIDHQTLLNKLTELFPEKNADMVGIVELCRREIQQRANKQNPIPQNAGQIPLQTWNAKQILLYLLWGIVWYVVWEAKWVPFQIVASLSGMLLVCFDGYLLIHGRSYGNFVLLGVAGLVVFFGIAKEPSVLFMMTHTLYVAIFWAVAVGFHKSFKMPPWTCVWLSVITFSTWRVCLEMFYDYTSLTFAVVELGMWQAFIFNSHQ